MSANGGYNAFINHVYSGNFHTPAPEYYTETEEHLEDLAAATANDKNALSEITHENVTLSVPNVNI